MRIVSSTYILLLLIVILATFLRFFLLGTIPASLNQDETSLGYTAYSFIKTASDEKGVLFPLSIVSFGDWKLPLYPWITTLPLLIFGVTEFAVRFPSATAGVIGTVLIYFISKHLFNNKIVGLISSLFYAVSPWSIYFSRMAYEVNVATTLFLGGILLVLKSQESKNTRLLIPAAFLFGLTEFTYHSYVIFTPLFLIPLILYVWNKVPHNKNAIIAFLITILFVFISAITTLQGSVNKLSSTSLFSDQNIIYNRVEKLRGDKSKENHIIKLFVHNKYEAVFYQIAQNYVSTFSTSFLFDKGGEKLLHNLGYFGNLYLIDALFISFGIISLAWNRNKYIVLFGIWLFIGPIPSAITKDAPSSTRLFILLPLFMLISSYGLYNIYKYLSTKRVFGRVISFLIIMLFLLNIIYFIDGYFIHIDVQRGRFLHYGFKQAVEVTQRYPNYNVVMEGPENFPYISFLFYLKYDPISFRKSVEYYPQTPEGFIFVKKFGRYEFVNSIDYNQLKTHTLYITSSRSNGRINSIFLPNGDPIFEYFTTK